MTSVVSAIPEWITKCRIDFGPDFACFTWGRFLSTIGTAVIVLIPLALLRIISNNQAKSTQEETQ